MVERKAILGIKWQLIGRIFQKLLSVFTFAILARLLDPAAFGLFAMAFLLIDALSIVQSLGLKSSVIQKQGDLELSKHTAFILIQIMGIVMFCVALAVAPAVSLFFDQAELTSVQWVLAFIFLITSFGKIPSAILNRNLEFKTIAWIRFFGALLNSVIAIALAIYLRNVWVLVIAYLIRRIAVVVMMWWSSKYRFRWQFDFGVARQLLNFGKFMVGLKLIAYGTNDLAKIVIGKMIGAASLGYFALSANLGRFVEKNTQTLISDILFPAYSAVQDDPSAVNRGYLKSIKFLSLLTFPVGLMLIFLAKELVWTIYGDKWLPVIPLLQLWGVSQFAFPLASCARPVFLGCGKPQYVFWLNLSSFCLSLPLLIFLTLRWGLQGAVASEVLVVFLWFPAQLILLKKTIGLHFRDFCAHLSSATCATLILGVVLLALRGLLEAGSLATNNLITLILLGGLGTAAYLIALALIDRDALNEGRKLLTQREG